MKILQLLLCLSILSACVPISFPRSHYSFILPQGNVLVGLNNKKIIILEAIGAEETELKESLNTEIEQHLSQNENTSILTALDLAFDHNIYTVDLAKGIDSLQMDKIKSSTAADLLIYPQVNTLSNDLDAITLSATAQNKVELSLSIFDVQQNYLLKQVKCKAHTTTVKDRGIQLNKTHKKLLKGCVKRILKRYVSS